MSEPPKKHTVDLGAMFTKTVTTPPGENPQPATNTEQTNVIGELQKQVQENKARQLWEDEQRGRYKRQSELDLKRIRSLAITQRFQDQAESKDVWLKAGLFAVVGFALAWFVNRGGK